MITIGVLRSWRPHRLGSIADDVVAHRRALVALQDELDAGSPPGDWSGDDSVVAGTTHGALVDSLVDEVAGLTVVVEALEVAQAAVTAAQHDLEGAISAARGKGLEVDVATGQVSAPPTAADDGPLDGLLSTASVAASVAAIEAALQRAADADADLSNSLGLAGAGVDSEASTLAGGAVLVRQPAPKVGPPGSIRTYAIALEGGLGVMAGTYMLVRVERLADGTVKVTKVLTDGAGYGVGAGFDLSVVHEDRRYGATTLAGADAMLTSGDGEVYIVDEDDFGDFMPALLIDAGASKVGDVVSQMSPIGLTRGLGDAVPGMLAGAMKLMGGDSYTLPDPVATIEQISAKAEGDAAWGLVAGGSSADVGATGTGSLITHEDGTKSLVYDVKADGAVRAYAGFDGDSLANASAEGDAGYRVTVDVGTDGMPEQARLDVTYGGQHAAYRGEPTPDANVDAGDNFYREQSFTVPLDDDATRAAFTRLTREGDVDGFLDATRDNATITRRDYDLETGTSGINAEGGGIIFKGGLTGEFSTESATTRDAEYWDGQRWQKWE